MLGRQSIGPPDDRNFGAVMLDGAEGLNEGLCLVFRCDDLLPDNRFAGYSTKNLNIKEGTLFGLGHALFCFFPRGTVIAVKK